MPDNINELGGERRVCRYPLHLLKRVDKPTTVVSGHVQRIDAYEEIVAKPDRGDYGAAVQAYRARHTTDGNDPLADALMEVTHHLGSLRGSDIAPVRAPVSDDPAVLSEHVKQLGYFLKADIVGICDVPGFAYYSRNRLGEEVKLDYQYAIILVMRKDYHTVNASQGYDWIADALSWQTYERLAIAAKTMAGYIKRLGYPASAQCAAGVYDIQIPPLLVLAGIGEVSRAGIILNPFLGMNYKAAVVLTDLPLRPDKPIDFGLQDFCRHCNICAATCPSKAISTGDKVMYNGYETWKLNVSRCYSFVNLNKRGHWCNMCVKVCPWTQPDTWPHRLVRWGAMRSGLARRVAIRGARLFGHAKAKERDKWWFDLAYQDGVLCLPDDKLKK